MPNSGNIATISGNNITNSGIDLSTKADLVGGKIPSSQLPSYVDDVQEYANLAAFPATGETGVIYVALDTNKIYRWSGSTYIEIASGAGAVWGGITGTLSNQTDLQTALNGKQASLNGTGFVRMSGTTVSYITGTSSQFVKADGSLDSSTYLTSYTETDTLATVTGRGASTSTNVTLSGSGNYFNGHHYFTSYDLDGNHYPHYMQGLNANGSKLNLRMYDASANLVLFHLNGATKAIQWDGNTIWHAGNDGTGSGLDADLLDGYHESSFLRYYGYSTSGDFQTFQSTAGRVRFDQVGAIDDPAWTNEPTGVYTYGGVVSFRGANFGLQIYGSHTGNLTFKTQWDNDQYSGWREILHSVNYNSYAPTLTGGGASGNWGINITGSAATLTTTRTIWGQNFNGSANVTGALSGATTIAMSGQLTNTVAVGTAPFVITSTTRVANLNVATAGTADTLTTARTINGTSFNGSANITTANWGTARTITIGATGKSVNGSADVSWSLAEIGAASSTHNHDLTRYSLAAPAIIDSVTTSNFRTQLFGSTTVGYNLSAARWNSVPTLLTGMNQYSTMFAWSGSDTHGFIAVDYASPYVTVGGGNADVINWTRRVAFTDGTGASGTWGISITGNADTVDGLHASAFALLNGSTSTSFGVLQLSYAQTQFNPAAAARTTVGEMSVKMWDNYFAGTGLGSDYGTVMEYYSRNGHVDTQVYFDAAGGSWYRTAPYNGAYGSWQRYVTENGTWGINVTGSAGTVATPMFNDGTTFISRYNAQADNSFKSYIIYNTTDQPLGSGLYNVMITRWASNYGSILAMNTEPGTGNLYTRQLYNNTWGSWRTVLDSSNYNSYALPLAGGTMTGPVTFSGATAYNPLTFTGGVASYSIAQQDGAGRVNWYWNKSGTGGSPTYQVSSEDAIRLKFSTSQAAGGEAGIGVYWAAANTAGVGITWIEVMGAFHNGFRVLAPATFSSSVTASGDVSIPYLSSYKWGGSLSASIYADANGKLYFMSGAALSFTIDFQGSSTFSALSITAPSFIKSGGTGSQVLLANGGTVSTATANTASTLVLRDGSGNFSAGTITATLSGNASSSSTTLDVASGTITDLNAAWTGPGTSISNGFRVFRYSDSATNKPVSVDNANWLINIYSHPTGGTASYGHQLAAADSDNIYFRKVMNGSFSSWFTLWHSGNLTNLNQLTNGPGYITGYTETDTLATVTGRGATTSTDLTFNGTLTMGTSGTQYIRMGRFPASLSNTGEAWIGRASDRSTGSMTVQLGGSSNASFFEVVDHGWTTVTLKVGMNDFSYKSNTVWHAGNDGAGSTLDADLLDGNHASAFALSTSLSSYLPLVGGILTGDLIITAANDTATGGGQIYINGANGNRIDFGAAGAAAPAFTTRSAGTKLVLYPELGAAAVDYALGIENNAMWYSVPVAGAARFFRWYGGTTNIATLDSSGKLTVANDVVAYGTPSDANLKTIKEVIPNALESIKKLTGYRFDWKNPDGVLNLKEDIGVIAQEVAAVLPELARTNGDGFMSVRYQGLTAVLIEAVKEQQAQIEDLKKQIDYLVENR